MGVFKTAARFIGKSARADLGYAEMGSEVLGKVGEYGVSGLKSIIKKHEYKEGANAVQKLFESPLGYDIKTKYALGIGAVIMTPAILDSGMQIKNKSSIGEITAGYAANQVNVSGSPFTEQQLNESSKRSFIKKAVSGNINTHGAEGDLVFALNNLRRG